MTFLNTAAISVKLATRSAFITDSGINSTIMTSLLAGAVKVLDEDSGSTLRLLRASALGMHLPGRYCNVL